MSQERLPVRLGAERAASPVAYRAAPSMGPGVKAGAAAAAASGRAQHVVVSGREVVELDQEGGGGRDDAASASRVQPLGVVEVGPAGAAEDERRQCRLEPPVDRDRQSEIASPDPTAHHQRPAAP